MHGDYIEQQTYTRNRPSWRWGELVQTNPRAPWLYIIANGLAWFATMGLAVYLLCVL